MERIQRLMKTQPDNGSTVLVSDGLNLTTGDRMPDVYTATSRRVLDVRPCLVATRPTHVLSSGPGQGKPRHPASWRCRALSMEPQECMPHFRADKLTQPPQPPDHCNHSVVLCCPTTITQSQRWDNRKLCNNKSTLRLRKAAWLSFGVLAVVARILMHAQVKTDLATGLMWMKQQTWGFALNALFIYPAGTRAIVPLQP